MGPFPLKLDQPLYMKILKYTTLSLWFFYLYLSVADPRGRPRKRPQFFQFQAYGFLEIYKKGLCPLP